MVHTGLSRSAIYDRMDQKSPRYAEDFPKSFSLSGGAVGWFKNEVDAWLEACATNAKSWTPSRKTTPSPNALDRASQALSTVGKLPGPSYPAKTSSRQPALARSIAQSQLKRPLRSRNLAEAIVEGGKINTRLLDYFQMKAWTPAMGALLVCGIAPTLDCNEIPDGGVGLDEKPLHGSNGRFHEARRILREWHDSQEESGDQSLEIEPPCFLTWCIKEDIDTEWLRLFLELIGCADENAIDLTASRFALLTNT
jgi:predicted DNA-binding transcriptional regulator AlpA